MISAGVETFLSYLRETETLNRISIANEQEANDETQDMLHKLELEHHSYNEFAKLAKLLSEIRKKRRAAKDLIDQTAPVVKWMEENRSAMRSLERLLGEIRKTEKNTQNRIYTPKTNVGEA